MNPKVVKIIVGIFTSLIVLSVGSVALANSLGFDIFKGMTDPKYARLEYKKKAAEDTLNEDEMNILIFGLDRNSNRAQSETIFRPDTIMLATVNLKEKSVKLVSTPRDSRVDIYNTSGRDKINSAFSHAYDNLNEADRADANKVFKEGIKYLEYTVSDILGGVSVDHYVGVDMDTIPQLATVMGGVTVNVKEDIYENYGHGSGNAIRIHKGKQILSGKDLLYYSRYRSYAGGDIDRVAVQQSIIKAILEQFKNSNSFTKIPKIYNLIKDSIETDMTFADIASLGYKFKDFDTNNLQTYTLPGNYGVLNSLSFWVVNQSERVKFIKELYGIEAKMLTQDPLTDGTSYNSSKDPGGGSGVTKPKDSSDDKPSNTPSKPDNSSGGNSGGNSGGDSSGGDSSGGNSGGDSSGGDSSGGNSGGGDSSGGDNSGGETGGGDNTPDTSN